MQFFENERFTINAPSSRATVTHVSVASGIIESGRTRRGHGEKEGDDDGSPAGLIKCTDSSHPEDLPVSPEREAL